MSGMASRGEIRWAYGLHAVARRLEVAPESVREVVLLSRPAGRLQVVEDRARRLGIAVRHGDAAMLRQLTGSDGHQGVAARTAPLEYQAWETAIGRHRGPLLVLDQIQDPHNLGALLRSAAAADTRTVILPERGGVGVTPAVEKVAAGAVSDLTICRVVNVARTLRALRERGYWTVGLVARGGDNLFRTALPEPIALVVGGETGLRPLVLRRCEVAVTIPMPGPVESLNAAVAGGIALFELVRRRSDA
jgi:23S rRNA (guanosine2251-2'-O)-methyltransferase